MKKLSNIYQPITYEKFQEIYPNFNHAPKQRNYDIVGGESEGEIKRENYIFKFENCESALIRGVNKFDIRSKLITNVNHGNIEEFNYYTNKNKTIMIAEGTYSFYLKDIYVEVLERETFIIKK